MKNPFIELTNDFDMSKFSVNVTCISEAINNNEYATVILNREKDNKYVVSEKYNYVMKFIHSYFNE